MNNPDVIKSPETPNTGSLERMVGHVPARWEQWNPAVRGAYLKGATAAHNRDNKCPYPDRRTRLGRITFSRVFIRAWEDGHADASAHMSNGELCRAADKSGGAQQQESK